MITKYIELTDLLTAYARIAHVPIYHMLLLSVTGDIVTGFSKAIIIGKINSSIGIKGLSKHFMIITICLLFAPYLWLMGYQVIGQILLASMITMYIASIIENLEEMGIPLPKELTKFFEQIKDRQNTIKIENPGRIEISKCKNCKNFDDCKGEKNGK